MNECAQYIKLQEALDKAIYSKELKGYVIPIETIKSLHRYVGSKFKKKENTSGWENYDPFKHVNQEFEG